MPPGWMDREGTRHSLISFWSSKAALHVLTVVCYWLRPALKREDLNKDEKGIAKQSAAAWTSTSLEPCRRRHYPRLLERLHVYFQYSFGQPDAPVSKNSICESCSRSSTRLQRARKKVEKFPPLISARDVCTLGQLYVQIRTSDDIQNVWGFTGVCISAYSSKQAS